MAIWTEEKLENMLTTPSKALIEDIAKIKGDIIVLGASGKMGPSLCILAKNAAEAAGIEKRIIAVARFTDLEAKKYLEENGVETIPCNLLDVESLNNLPNAENVIYMAGRKFGTDGEEWKTWAMNATLPAFVVQKYKNSRILVFSSGNIYPLVPVSSGGCTESIKPRPVGEYTMSCLARERAFEYAANTFGTKVTIFRLSYAVDLRYGVLCDIASAVYQEKPISIRTPSLNAIWQGTANEIAIRGLLIANSPVEYINVTGPETISIRKTAESFGKMFNKTPIFVGEEQNDAYLNDASKSIELFGYPSVSANTMIRWQAEWILEGGRMLNKPTHYEERGGSY